MMKRLMTGLLALTVLCGFVSQSNAETTRFRFKPGANCMRYQGSADSLEGNLGAGQYVYVSWLEYVGEGAQEAQPNFMPVKRDNTFNDDDAMPLYKSFPKRNWYVFQVPATADYVLDDSDGSDDDDSRQVDICVLNNEVPLHDVIDTVSRFD